MKLYKLTNEYGVTGVHVGHRAFWGPGVEHTAEGGGKLCTDKWLHAYRDPHLAVVMDDVHGAYLPVGKLWLCEGDVGVDDGTKVGCTRIKTIEVIPTPEVSYSACLHFAILCAMSVFQYNFAWLKWAQDWINGHDRSYAASCDAFGAAHACATNLNNVIARAAIVAASASAQRNAAYTAGTAAAHAAKVKQIDFIGLLHTAIRKEKAFSA